MSEVAAPPRRLLLLEPDTRLRKRLATSLAAHGCEVRAAAAVDEAVRLSRAHVFDYAVIDPGSEAGPARDLIRELKAANPALRTLLFSPYRTSVAALQNLHTDGVSYLQKPADTDEVLEALGLARSD
jgi:ActR/RegA family two-component response regulator